MAVHSFRLLLGIGTSKSGDVEPATLLTPQRSAGVRTDHRQRSAAGRRHQSERPGSDPAALHRQGGSDDDQRRHQRTARLLTPLQAFAAALIGMTARVALELGSVIDAVDGSVPTRTLRRDLVGNLLHIFDHTS